MFRYATAITLVLLFCAGCPDVGGGPGGTGGGSSSNGGGGVAGGGVLDKTHSTGGQSWTVLVYMTADNDLEPFALQDLSEMMAVGSSNNFNLVVQVDRAEGYANDAIGGLPDFTGTKRVKVQQGSLEELSDLGEQNMADPATLADFVTWGIKTFPADRTAVVFWDHGGGWVGFGVDEASGGALLNLTQIEQGLRQGLAGANAKPLALVGFDACLMATYEVSLTLSPHAEYLLASEETEPGHGWDWRAMATLAQDPSSDPVALGRSVIRAFRDQAIEQQTADGITLSLIDLYRMGTMQQAVGALISAYGTGTPELTTAFGRGQEAAQKFGDAPEPSRAQNMVDLMHVVSSISDVAQNQAITAAKTQLQGALSQTVLENTAGAARSKATGMSVYFPPQKAYYSAGYDQLAGATQWRALLQAYFGISSGGGIGVPTFTNPNKLGEFGFDTQNNLVLGGTLAQGNAANVSRATLLYGITIDSNFVILGDKPAVVSDPNVGGLWNIQALSFAQGTNFAFAYTNLAQVDATHFSLNVLFQYQRSAQAAKQDCLRQISFSADSAGDVTLTSDAYYVATNGAYGELSPELGSTLMPLLQVIDANGNQTIEAAATTPFTASLGTDGRPEFALTLEYKGLKSGTTVFEILTVENAGGQGDAVIGQGVLP